ncbi:cytochrome P450 alkane hydroxylase-like protein [Zopfia rhizophila CBS 207.26]|uniref:Cytochrome P450 alkane hydroxylase-like protein n=1 Tax=Zopfia rhizophila CBS 207.26 TaxID=1314779 RepID=A0A6A6EE81_9PEZI|nr:cytochrome P450 alkane hydroxylase-like protein [Zopfia rhizophila CBS 207.26]
MNLLISLTLASLVLFILQFYIRCIQRSYSLKKAYARHGCASPKNLPSKDPIFGLDTVVENVKTMKNHCRMRAIQTQARNYGHTFQSFPFGRRTLTTTSARNIQTVLSLEHEKFGVRPIRGPAEAMTGPGIISNDGKVWEHARAMIRPAFTRAQIADRELFDAHIERFFSLLPTDGTAVDLQPLFDRLILDASSEFIFGESFGSLLPSCPIDSQKFLDSFNNAQKGVGIRVLLGNMRFLMRDRNFSESCKLIQDYTQKHIDRALQQPQQQKKSEEDSAISQRKCILVYELAKETSDRSLLCNQLLNVFFAGRDTPAVALTNIFFLLARHPEVWKKCRGEIQGLQKEDLTFERLKSLRYIQHVINEAMRLYPPVAAQTRGCVAPAILPTGGGPDGSRPIHVQSGDTVIINFFTLHRDSKMFAPDPEVFRPERWIDARPTWEFLPFGGGARHCPAQQLALFWVAYTLVRMLLIFREIRNEDPVEDFVENMKLNMESLNGAKVSFVSV